MLVTLGHLSMSCYLRKLLCAYFFSQSVARNEYCKTHTILHVANNKRRPEKPLFMTKQEIVEHERNKTVEMSEYSGSFKHGFCVIPFFIESINLSLLM